MGQLETLWVHIGSLGLPIPAIKALCAQVPTHHYGIPIADRHFIAHLENKGLQTHVWTVNNETEMRRLLDFGVKGIMSDDSALLKQVLEEHGRWH